VRALAERGAGVLDKPVSRTMTRKVSTCNESETVSNIMERMTSGKFRHVPVVDQGRLVGIVSIGDVVKHRLHEMERDSAAMRPLIPPAKPGGNKRHVDVREVMNEFRPLIAAVGKQLFQERIHPEFHGRFSEDFTTDMAESDFRYTQGAICEAPRRQLI
jgi:hypothetical protein